MFRILFCSVGVASAQPASLQTASVVPPPLTPSEIAAKLGASMRDLKLPDANRVPASCGGVMCADISDTCDPANGVEVQWPEGTCCPVCQTPGYVKGGQLVEMHLTDQARTAPVACVGPAPEVMDPDSIMGEAHLGANHRFAKCFNLMCGEDEVPGPPAAGGCCDVCVKK